MKKSTPIILFFAAIAVRLVVHFATHYADGLTAVILYRWSQHLDLGKLAILPAVIYIVFPRSVICDIAGMV
jgi:hypothetical protein